MNSSLKWLLLAVIVSVFSQATIADTSKLEEARKAITTSISGVKPENISVSPVPGIYQVLMPPRMFYVSQDGRYVISGNLFDVKTQQNLSDVERNKSVITAVNEMGEDSMIIFGNKSLKHTVTVFTDIDCGYCRKLHNEVKKYNQNGIQIRYMAYPRAGIGSDAFKKAESVWCSKNKSEAMTLAKSGATVETKKCESPVARHFALGNMIGIRGTPAMVLEDGTVIPGYVPAERLSTVLKEKLKN